MVQHMNVPALKQQWVLDAQWTDCPLDVEEDVKKLWRWRELGNDNYMLRCSLNDLEEWNTGDREVEEWFWGEPPEEQKGWVTVPLKIDALLSYMRASGIPDDEQFIIHWWW